MRPRRHRNRPQARAHCVPHNPTREGKQAPAPHAAAAQIREPASPKSKTHQTPRPATAPPHRVQGVDVVDNGLLRVDDTVTQVNRGEREGGDGQSGNNSNAHVGREGVTGCCEKPGVAHLHQTGIMDPSKQTRSYQLFLERAWPFPVCI